MSTITPILRQHEWDENKLTDYFHENQQFIPVEVMAAWKRLQVHNASLRVAHKRWLARRENEKLGRSAKAKWIIAVEGAYLNDMTKRTTTLTARYRADADAAEVADQVYKALGRGTRIINIEKED